MTKKREKPKLHKHHRRPRSRGGGNEPSNISIVREKDHRAYHQLFGNMLPDEMAAMLTDTWIDSNYYMVAVPRYKKHSLRRKRLFCTTCDAEVLKFLETTKKEE